MSQDTAGDESTKSTGKAFSGSTLAGTSPHDSPETSNRGKKKEKRNKKKGTRKTIGMTVRKRRGKTAYHRKRTHKISTNNKDKKSTRHRS